MTPREMLTAPMAFLAPAAALDGLTPAAADQRLPGANHSIAEIVAHLAFWQQWFLRRFNGVAEPMVQRAGEGWPAVTPGAWGEVEGAFRSGLILLVSEAEKATGAGLVLISLAARELGDPTHLSTALVGQLRLWLLAATPTRAFIGLDLNRGSMLEDVSGRLVAGVHHERRSRS